MRPIKPKESKNNVCNKIMRKNRSENTQNIIYLQL